MQNKLVSERGEVRTILTKMKVLLKGGLIVRIKKKIEERQVDLFSYLCIPCKWALTSYTNYTLS